MGEPLMPDEVPLPTDLPWLVDTAAKLLGVSPEYIRDLCATYASRLSPAVYGRAGRHPRRRRMLSPADVLELRAILREIRGAEAARRASACQGESSVG